MEGSGPSRRTVVAGLGGGAALVWVAPVVTRVSLASAAASSEPQPDGFVISAPMEQGQRLAGFLRSDPTTFLMNVLLTGLSPNAVVVGIDFRPSNALLYGVAGVGGAAELYIIDPLTGAADLQGTLPSITLKADEHLGIDFDPSADELRVVTTRSQNLRIDPDALVVSIDTPLSYPSDPQPTLTAAAYTGSGTLYGIDSTRDVLVIQSPPNDGTLSIIGTVVTDVGDLNGFDITTSSGLDAAFAAFRKPPANTAGFAAMNLTTGALVPIGNLGTTDAAGGPAFKDVNGLALR